MRIAIVLLSAITYVACASPVSDEAKQDLAKPVDCSTAEADIAALQAEKASVGKQAAAGVTSVVPVGAVAGLLTGQAKDKGKVATGAYNREIDEKIAQIQSICGMD